MPSYRTTGVVTPRKCPDTGLTCDAWVCNEGDFACDPAHVARIKASAPLPAAPGIVENDDGVILSADIEDEGAAFAIEP